MAPSRRAIAALLVLACAALAASAARVKALGMRDAERTKQLRILAFGDSLTEGWIDSTEEKHPYTWNLEWRLKERLKPKGISVQITNGGAHPSVGSSRSGRGGWRFGVAHAGACLFDRDGFSPCRRPAAPKGVGSAGVLDRLNDAWYSRLREARDAGRPYQYAIFLAGINDILLQWVAGLAPAGGGAAVAGDAAAQLPCRRVGDCGVPLSHRERVTPPSCRPGGAAPSTSSPA
jgi:lysophospholipase L1-like esterase